jgi:hypothetical protein
MPTLDRLASCHHALEPVDTSPFQRKARILQSLWREQHRLPIGTQTTPRGGQRPLGSRLAMPEAQTQLWNFLSDTTKAVVRDEVLNYAASKGKLYARPRIFSDLLSSQPLTFNLFAELQRDLPLATKVLGSLTSSRVHAVTAIRFEHSPGRANARYTGDKSAFDVFVEYQTATGGRGCIGVEVKYHENLLGKAAATTERHHEVCTTMACFKTDALSRLRQSPLQQIWRDHLLVGATQHADAYDDAFFLLLYPEQNPHVQSAAAAYAGCLTTPGSFYPVTLESFTRHLRPHTKSPWLDRFQDRYLNFPKVDALLAKP